MFSGMLNWLSGTRPDLNVSADYSLNPLQSSSVPLLSEILPSNNINLNTMMPTSNYGGSGWGGLGNFLNNHGGTLLGVGQGLGNLFMGMRQYGLARDALDESRRQFDVNYDAQRKLTNSRLEDRQNARNAARPGFHESTEDYMRRFGV